MLVQCPIILDYASSYKSPYYSKNYASIIYQALQTIQITQKAKEPPKELAQQPDGRYPSDQPRGQWTIVGRFTRGCKRTKGQRPVSPVGRGLHRSRLTAPTQSMPQMWTTIGHCAASGKDHAVSPMQLADHRTTQSLQIYTRKCPQAIDVDYYTIQVLGQ